MAEMCDRRELPQRRQQHMESLESRRRCSPMAADKSGSLPVTPVGVYAADRLPALFRSGSWSQPLLSPDSPEQDRAIMSGTPMRMVVSRPWDRPMLSPSPSAKSARSEEALVEETDLPPRWQKTTPSSRSGYRSPPPQLTRLLTCSPPLQQVEQKPQAHASARYPTPITHSDRALLHWVDSQHPSAARHASPVHHGSHLAPKPAEEYYRATGPERSAYAERPRLSIHPYALPPSRSMHPADRREFLSAAPALRESPASHSWSSPASSTGSGPASSIKGPRKRADDVQLSVLNKVFDRTAYPSTEERHALARQLGMTSRSVQIWFQNRRRAVKVEQQSAIQRAEAEAIATSARARGLPGPPYLNEAYPHHNATRDTEHV